MLKKIFSKTKSATLNLFFSLFPKLVFKSKNNFVAGSKTKFIKCQFSRCKQNTLSIGANCVFQNCKFHFGGKNCQIIIGDNNKFIDVDFWLEDRNSSIIIGKNNFFTGQCQIASIEGQKVVFGDNNLISSKVHLRNGDSHSLINNNGERINDSKDISIGNHVWIGTNVYILKGVSIGHDSVIGCGSIVTKSFVKNNICIGGNPAKIIKENINWDGKRI